MNGCKPVPLIISQQVFYHGSHSIGIGLELLKGLVGVLVHRYFPLPCGRVDADVAGVVVAHPSGQPVLTQIRQCRQRPARCGASVAGHQHQSRDNQAQKGQSIFFHKIRL